MKPPKQPVIPLHRLHDHTQIGLKVVRYEPDHGKEGDDALHAHRDDHYIFLLVEQGTAEMTVDFQEVALASCCIYFIQPAQIHHGKSLALASGWFLAVESTLLTAQQRQVFEHRMALQQPVFPGQECLRHCINQLTALHHHQNSDQSQPFFLQVLHSLLQAFTGTVAALYHCTETAGQPTRKTEITYAFKTLLRKEFRTIKSPSSFAEKLNISGVYLNEAVKQTTGMPVSYWIAQEIMLEAKRLLYYSNLAVKEIAAELGYEDHTYFSRLFKEQTGMTPLLFRNNYLV